MPICVTLFIVWGLFSEIKQHFTIGHGLHMSGCNFLRFVFWIWTISRPDNALSGGTDTNMEALLSELPSYFFDIAISITCRSSYSCRKANRGVCVQVWIQFQHHSCCKHAWNNQHWSFYHFIAVIVHELPSFVDSHLCFGAVWCLHPYTGFSSLLVHNSCDRGPGYISCSVPLFWFATFFAWHKYNQTLFLPWPLQHQCGPSFFSPEDAAVWFSKISLPVYNHM